MRLDVQVTGMESLLRKLDVMKSGTAKRATAMALNKVATKGRSEVSRQVRARFAIKAREVSSSVKIIRASAGHPVAVIDIFGSPSKKGRSMNLIRFHKGQMSLSALKREGVKVKRGQRKPLKFQIKRGGSAKMIEGAFVGNKGRTIFQRTGDKRLPIKSVQVIGVSQMFNTRTVRAKVMAKLEADMRVELDRAIKHVIRSVNA